MLLYLDEILLHVSRGVRWDSDHVVILSDELEAIAQELVRGGYLDRVHIGLDFFDASINRVAAWVIGARAMLKALLLALLEPTETPPAARGRRRYHRAAGASGRAQGAPLRRGLGPLLPVARRTRRPRLAGGGQGLRTRRALEARLSDVTVGLGELGEPTGDRHGDAAGVDRNQQGVCRRARLEGGLVRPAGRRGSRPGRRKRRGQIDADQGDHRRPSAGRGNDRGPGPSGRRPRSGPCARPGNRRDLPAAGAVSGPDGRREHRDRARAGRGLAPRALGPAAQLRPEPCSKKSARRSTRRPKSARCRCPSSNWSRSRGPWGPKPAS